jgi:hypothetical protein
MSKIPTNQKPGGAVAKTQPTETPKSARVHKPDRMGLSPNGGSSSRGKGQK